VSPSAWEAASFSFRSDPCLGFPLKTAAAISLSTVIATSSAVSARRAGNQLINLRLGMALEVATTAGSLLGGITRSTLRSPRCSAVRCRAAAVAVVMLVASIAATSSRIRRGSRAPWRPFLRRGSGGVVTYRVKRLPLALGASFVAGNVSSLLGIGGGIIKVPVLNAWCGMPLRAAAPPAR
jgi:uncharacterized membrane protein YfcA